MNVESAVDPAFELDPGLTEHQSLWADALRAVANSWRFKVKAGRLSGHSLTGVLQLIASFEAAARLLEHQPEAPTPTPRVAEELHESEERFRLLVDTIKDYAIFLLDPNGNISSWNAGAERIKGYRAEEIIGRPFTVFYEREAQERGHPEYELKIAAREGRYHEEGWRIRKDGGRFWAEVTITALRDSTGQLRGFAKVTRDLTERRRQEEALREANTQLEQKVQERTTELAALNEELESFSYSISHDLRAPLRAIEGFSRVLQEDYASALDGRGRHYLERVRSGSQRMASLIDDLLKLSRVTRAELLRAPVDLSGIAREVVEELRRQAPDRTVTASLVPSAPAVGDPRLLRVVLENLLSNAWKFTARKADAHIEFGLWEEGGERRFYVRDNGAGFEMAYADKLFTPFHRLHDDEEFEGTGIGLATVQRVIRRHGGRIWAEGEPGRGATFWFTLGAT